MTIDNILSTLLIVGAAYAVGLVVFLALKSFRPVVEEKPVISMHEGHKKAA
ncbi:MAG: hypothetical protein Q4D58_00365 [Synergistaceae bacterium]|nr:hypothetical protein [Synergistaceae bacterium]